MSKTQQWWGISVRPDGEVHVTAPRRDERAAEILAEQVEGTAHFAVQANTKAQAKSLAEQRIREASPADRAVVAPETLSDEEREALDALSSDEARITEMSAEWQGIQDAEVTEQPRDEFAPTEAELAEAAQLREQLEEAAKQVAQLPAPTKAAPRAAEKTGIWYGCARDKDDEPMVTQKPYASSKVARDAASIELPNKPARIVAVEASSGDEALAIYEALPQEGKLPEEVTKPRTSTPRQSLVALRTVPVESDAWLVSATGMLHASPECRFIKGKDSVALTTARDAADRVMKGETLLADDNRRKASSYCVYCAAVKEGETVATVPAEVAEVVAEVIERVESEVEVVAVDEPATESADA